MTKIKATAHAKWRLGVRSKGALLSNRRADAMKKESTTAIKKPRRDALVAGLTALLVFCGSSAGADELVVEVRMIPELKAVFGRVESRDVVAARARIGGTVTEIRVDEGSQVESGAIVAVVVDEKIALRVMDVAEARRNRAVIVQQSAEGEVLAPASGRVLTVPVTQGSVVLPGETIATIAGGGFFLRLALPERHAAEIVEGDTVLVGRRALVDTAEDLPTATQGRLAKVYPEIDSGRVLADVEVEGLGDYFVGERTRVWIPVGRRPAILIPLAAVTTRHGVDYVRVVEDGKPIEVAVILGETMAEADGRMVEVLSGLREGDRIEVP